MSGRATGMSCPLHLRLQVLAASAGSRSSIRVSESSRPVCGVEPHQPHAAVEERRPAGHTVDDAVCGPARCRRPARPIPVARRPSGGDRPARRGIARRAGRPSRAGSRPSRRPSRRAPGPHRSSAANRRARRPYSSRRVLPGGRVQGMDRMRIDGGHEDLAPGDHDAAELASQLDLPEPLRGRRRRRVVAEPLRTASWR